MTSALANLTPFYAFRSIIQITKVLPFSSVKLTTEQQRKAAAGPGSHKAPAGAKAPPVPSALKALSQGGRSAEGNKGKKEAAAQLGLSSGEGYPIGRPRISGATCSSNMWYLAATYGILQRLTTPCIVCHPSLPAASHAERCLAVVRE